MTDLPDPCPGAEGKEDVTNLTRRRFLQAAGAAGAGLALGPPSAQGKSPGEPEVAALPRAAQARSQEFAAAFQDGAMVSLKAVNDPLGTEWVQPGQRLGDILLRYRAGGGEWETAETWELGENRTVRSGFEGREHEVVYRIPVAPAGGGEALLARLSFAVEDSAIRWGITLENQTGRPLEIGDLAIPLPVNRNRGGRNEPPPGPPILKHSLVSGDGSFHFWMKGDSLGPYLVLTQDENTRLEYWESQGGYRAFLHAAVSERVARERGCRWRQPVSSLALAPVGQSGNAQSYGFTFRWADGYEGVRQVLVEEGLIDVNVVPGMTIPSDLSARLALRSRQRIRSVEAEFPGETRIRSLGSRDGVDSYEVRFSRLGENRLTVRFGDDRYMVLEFFCTEPLETLIRKRGAFIAAHQHRNPDLWYDGLLAEWAMDTQVMLGPDNYDRIQGWRIYEVTCDDPGLSKPAFLSSKNAEYPVQSEVEALDYYIENFVWGGLQKTTDETFSYGIYGIPDWKTNRDSEDPGRNGRQHIWRIYDYSHITLMYLSMYRVAKNFPHIRTSLTAREYLRRAYGTALAMFTIPWEVERWSAYHTGLYNELVIPQVVIALEAEGMQDRAERLRPHWERKVRTFVNDRPDLFRSEYAFDSTGFEATHALAKYALQVAEPGPVPESEVRVGWVDYPAPTKVPLENAQEFMEVQMAANLFCRGWLETAYYYLGSDYRGGGGDRYTLSYMSQMGGWAVLDYGLHHAADPWPYLRLGYASYLSAWALMNTGTPESDFGYWYPGPENDGGCGGGFEASSYGQTWLEQPHHRGSWYYSCEEDLGYCGALRGARTVVADDPIFGRFCLGGTMEEDAGVLTVTPRDGVRRRFHAMLVTGRVHLESEVARFAGEKSIALWEDLSQLRFRLESDDPADHTATVRIRGLPFGEYFVSAAEHELARLDVGDGGEAVLRLPMNVETRGREFSLARV